MKFRIFYALDDGLTTFEEVYILLSNGKLYCNILYNDISAHIIKENINYELFVSMDFYRWGKGVQSGRGIASPHYQRCEKELTWKQYTKLTPSGLLAIDYPNLINRQIRWLESYLKEQGLSKDDWDKEMFEKRYKIHD